MSISLAGYVKISFKCLLQFRYTPPQILINFGNLPTTLQSISFFDPRKDRLNLKSSSSCLIFFKFLIVMRKLNVNDYSNKNCSKTLVFIQIDRTPKSWALITLFYLIYYAFLACFWGLMLFVFFQTLDMNTPKWVAHESIIGTSPGLGLRPGKYISVKCIL